MVAACAVASVAVLSLKETEELSDSYHRKSLNWKAG